jgi:uncharacterized protein involved in type VI secretion and phage assembly
MSVANGTKKYYGKYRGTVIDNLDPLQIGRLMVQVPDLAGLVPSTWAMPCVPIAGKQMGVYVVPQTGAGVWVEFEQGNPDHPIWVGGFWGLSAEVPPLALAGVPASPSLVLQSALMSSVVISDLPGPSGGIMLKSASGSAMLIVNDTGIYIQNGQGASIVMTGSVVTVNNGALVVS